MQRFLDIPDNIKLEWNKDKLNWNLGAISSCLKTNNFLVNCYGPPSGYKLANADYPPWNTSAVFYVPSS